MVDVEKCVAKGSCREQASEIFRPPFFAPPFSDSFF